MNGFWFDSAGGSSYGNGTLSGNLGTNDYSDDSGTVTYAHDIQLKHKQTREMLRSDWREHVIRPVVEGVCALIRLPRIRGTIDVQNIGCLNFRRVT